MDNAKVYLRAVWDYNAAGNFTKNGLTDISIRKNDLVLLLETLPNGWVKGQKEDGAVGFVPANYVKKEVSKTPPMQASPQAVSQPQKPATNGIPKLQLIAVYDYSATGITENGFSDMNLKKGETISLHATLPNGWIIAENSSGKVGLLPTTHIKKLDSVKKNISNGQEAQPTTSNGVKTQPPPAQPQNVQNVASPSPMKKAATMGPATAQPPTKANPQNIQNTFNKTNTTQSSTPLMHPQSNQSKFESTDL